MRGKFSIELPLFVVLISCIFLLPSSVSGQSSPSTPPPCLYFVTQQNCPPCRQMDPVIDALVKQGYPVKIVHLENNRAWAQWAKVERTPTVVMLNNDRIVKRYSGIVGQDILQGWFTSAGVSPRPVKQKRLPDKFNRHWSEPQNSNPSLANATQAGTTYGKNANESLALAATVKIGLDVATQPYVDFASGTAIYNKGDTSLILTCGHLFRESNGEGKVTVIMGTGDGGFHEFGGTLLKWDATNRDVALVHVNHPGIRLPVNPIAPRSTKEFGFDGLFTVGCDLSNRPSLGETYNAIRETGPTIRQTQIKKVSNYDGIYKFDIVGSPVQGRSGGGLFMQDGKLIGVCNARICDADEGIYTGLDSVYWVIDEANLANLFEPVVEKEYLLSGGVSGAQALVASGGFEEVVERGLFTASQVDRRDVSVGGARPQGSKVIIIIQNESGESELITVENPSSELLGSVRAFQQGRLPSTKQLEITSSRTRENR